MQLKYNIINGIGYYSSKFEPLQTKSECEDTNNLVHNNMAVRYIQKS